MIRENITPADVVDFLNELVALDPDAMQELFLRRVPCNRQLADHPTVQVGASYGVTAGGVPVDYNVGPLGIINGLLGTLEHGPRMGWGPISGRLREGRLEGFELTQSA